MFNTLVSAVFAETQNPNDTEFDEFFSRIDIISRRDEIVSRMISSITEWIEYSPWLGFPAAQIRTIRKSILWFAVYNSSYEEQVQKNRGCLVE